MGYVTSPERKKKALLLRHQGKSYAEITQELGIPKSTLAGWLKGVGFSEKIKQDQLVRVKQIWAKNIVTFNAKRHKMYLEKTEEQLEKHANEVSSLTRQDRFFLTLGLFWAEGSKKERWRVRIANADPIIIQVCMKFFREDCKVAKEKFYGYVHIHPNIKCDQAISYWSDVSDINQERIRAQTVVSSASQGKRPKNTLPYGTFHLYVQDLNFARKMQGWLRGVRRKSILPE